jgi:hypothetical protein
LRPKVVGKACWSSVRPAIKVSRWASASPARAAAIASVSVRIKSSARFVRSMAAVSKMSWLVAPLWTYRAASSDTSETTSVSILTSGGTGLP